MRLIDVDDAIDKIDGLCVESNENWIGTDNQSFVDHSEVIDILCDAPTVDAVPIDADLGMMLTCAVRYACGRRTYIPSIIIDYITPLILHLDDTTLAIINKDLDEAARTGGYGDPQIDESRWKAFHALIQQERLLRAGHHCKERGDSDV